MKNNKENQSKLDDINFDNLIEKKDVPIDFDKFEEEILEENDEPSLLNKNDIKKLIKKKIRISESFEKKVFILSTILYVASMILFESLYVFANILFYISLSLCILLNCLHSKYGQGLIIFYVIAAPLFYMFFLC